MTEEKVERDILRLRPATWIALAVFLLSLVISVVAGSRAIDERPTRDEVEKILERNGKHKAGIHEVSKLEGKIEAIQADIAWIKRHLERGKKDESSN